MLRVTTYVDPAGLIPWGRASVSVLVRIEAPALPPQQVPPVHLALALDVSGSMAGAKLAMAKAAARRVLERLRPQDVVALILFRDRVRVVREAAPLGEPATLIARLESVLAAGASNLSGAWSEAAREVRAGCSPAGPARVLLLSDGGADAGVTSRKRLLAMTEAARDDAEAPVLTSCLAVGGPWDRRLLAALADAGGGTYGEVADEASVPAFFTELGELCPVAAQNVTLRLRLAPSVSAVHQVGAYPSWRAREQRAVGFRLGDLLAGETALVGLVCDVDLAESAPEGVPLVSGEVGWFDVAAEAPGLREVPVRAAARLDPSGEQERAGQRDLWRLRLARARRRALRAGERGDSARARAIATTARHAAERAGALDEPAVAAEVERLVSLERLLEAPRAWGVGSVPWRVLRYGAFRGGAGLAS